MKRRFVAALAIVWASSLEANPVCRQALALGLDVSGSVDAVEYRLQLDGLATALADPDVSAALLAQPDALVTLAVFEWSTPGQDRLILDWTPVRDAAALAEIQATLRATTRAEMGPATGLGAALRVGASLLDQRPECWARTLDISGDGKGNIGQRPQDVTDIERGITVNGLVIGVDDGAGVNERSLQIGELAAYYTAYVIRGPDAFVETAIGFEDYAEAMRRKLLRELTTLAIAQAAPVAGASNDETLP